MFNFLNPSRRAFTAALFAVIASVSLVRCDLLGIGGEDEEDNTGLLALLLFAASPPACSAGTTALTGTLTASVAIPRGGCVTLESRVFVPSGVTLTLPDGTIVFGRSGSALFVESGGQLIATGTASRPVVFTSSQAAGSRQSGDWGGVLIVGRAFSNHIERTVEGVITTTPRSGVVAGATDTDSSGTLSYVRIEYAGVAVGSGNELNSLSLYTVGSGTTLDHIQVHAGLDDGVEFFGGAVNGKYLLSTAMADDDFDIDEGYIGKLQFLIAHRYPSGSFTAKTGTSNTDTRCLEWDGAASGANYGIGNGAGTDRKSTPDVANLTCIGSFGVFGVTQGTAANSPGAFWLREGMGGRLTHAIAWGFDAAGNGGIGAACVDVGASQQAGTNIQVTNARVGSSASLFDTGGEVAGGVGTCNIAAGIATDLTSSPITSLGSVLTGTGGDYQTTLAAAPQNITAVNAAFSDAFFTANTTYGGALAGDSWWLGWTDFSIN